MDYGNFISIKEGLHINYGGYQEWFESSINKKVGCAAVAAANITAFLSNNKEMKKLYSYKDFSKDEFIKHMEEIIKYVIPNEEFGVISAMYFMDRVKKFANDKGVKLNGKFITIVEPYNKIEEFIIAGLKNNLPIALLMYKNEKLFKYDWHWVTITRLYKNEENIYLTISTWGERRVINMKDFYNHSAYGALVYFFN